MVKNPNIERLNGNKNLTFFTGVATETGIYKDRKVATYHNCKITIFETGTVIFSGSIHKLWNSLKNNTTNKGHGFNGNTFRLKDIMFIKHHLMDIFGCQPQQLILRNIEFGINIDTNFEVKTFLSGLLFHKGKMFENSYNNHFYKVIHQQYILKIYDKGSHYNLNTNTLRFEIKFQKMIELTGIGIYSMNEITPKTLLMVEKILLGRFQEIVYYDRTISKHTLTKREKENLKNYSNPRFWIDDLKPVRRDRHKKKLQTIIESNSNKLHQQILIAMEKKCVIINPR